MAFGNGKWYWYVTATIKNQAYPGIGVAVADSPAGPYIDPIKKPLVKGWFKIDPSVIIDDNGQDTYELLKKSLMDIWWFEII